MNENDSTASSYVHKDDRGVHNFDIIVNNVRCLKSSKSCHKLPIVHCNKYFLGVKSQAFHDYFFVITKTKFLLERRNQS